MVHRRPFATRLTFIGATVALATALLAPVAVSAAAPAIRFSLALNVPGECIAVITDGNSPTNVTLRNAAGDIKAQGTIPADDLWLCLDSSTWVESGDKLKATDDSATRTWIVPDLSVEVDRAGDLFSGTGPAGRTIRVEYAQGIFADVGESHGVRVGQDGHWSFDPNQDLIGGLDGAVSWKSPNDDRVSAYGAAPQITVTIDKPKFTGWTGSFNEVNVDLDGTPDATGHAEADINGAFSGKFRNSQNHLRPLEVGDHLYAPSLAADADWVVPQIDVSVDTDTDVVNGRCHDTGNASGTAIVEDHRAGHRRGYTVLSTDNDGSFEFDFNEVGHFFADPANVTHGDTLVVRCMIDTGDWVQLRSVVP